MSRKTKNAQQSVHLTLGILRTSQAVFHAFSFFWLDGFAVPAPAQVTQTVGRWRITDSIIESSNGNDEEMKTKDFLGKEWDINCMGCAISDNSMSAPGGFIQKTQYFCVHQDPLIPLSGFLVIASLRHIQSISDMQKSEYEDFSNLLRVTHYAIKKATGIENLTIVQEESSRHFHLWFFPWTQYVVEKYGKPSLAKIREIMADYKKQTIGEVKWKELEESIEMIKQYSHKK